MKEIGIPKKLIDLTNELANSSSNLLSSVAVI
jgi:hypothetical protein